MIKYLILSLFLFVFLTSETAAYGQQEKGETAFTGVNVLTMTGPKVLRKQTVIVKDGKIARIGPATEIKPSAGAAIIDGKGKYLMPGISEMHAHIPVPQDGDDQLVRETLLLYLSNGITVIRGMLGQPYHLELREQVANGSILGPRIYTSSPSLNGNTVKTPEEARQKVTQYQQDGYDFLKIHPGIELAVFEELVRIAREVGISFAGHVPVAVGVRRAIDFGYASIDHLDGYVEGLVPADFGVDPAAGGLFGFNFTDQVDRKQIDELVRKTKDGGIWIVPTQSLLVRWNSPKTGAEMATGLEMKYVKPATRLQWRTFKQQLLNDPNYDPEKAERFIGIRKQLLKSMEKQGVDLLLGSDAPQVFNVPGFSIQHEMKAMAEAGLSNFTILQSGTANPARFFQAEGQFGTIVEGAAADLILLEADPLDDIDNMQRRAGVMVCGKWLSKEWIDQQLAEIAKRHQN